MRKRTGSGLGAVVFSATCHPVRVLRGAFIFGGRKREREGGGERRKRRGEARNCSDALQRGPLVTLLARASTTATSYIPRGKKDRCFWNLLLLVKHWISSWNDRINFFAFPRGEKSPMQLEIPFFFSLPFLSSSSTFRSCDELQCREFSSSKNSYSIDLI